jgi:hypothetical protein
MKDVIKSLENKLLRIENMSSIYDRAGLDHGSADQTRAMLFESMFEIAINNIEGAIKQLKILERELY